MLDGGRQPSCDGTSRMNREVHVRFCEGLGVKFPGPTRPKHQFAAARQDACCRWKTGPLGDMISAASGLLGG
jgi:hypothetical protein